MRVRRSVAALAGAIWLVVGVATSPVSAATASTDCSTEDFAGDPRLGPRDLPSDGSVGVELRGYNRLGGLTPA